MRKVMIAAMAGLVLTGCNTVEGFGRDLSATGGAISGAAHDAKTSRPAKEKKRAVRETCRPNPSHGTSPAVC